MAIPVLYHALGPVLSAHLCGASEEPLLTHQHPGHAASSSLTPADRLAAVTLRFLHVEAIGGAFLLAAAVLAVAWANSPWAEHYEALLHTHLAVSVGVFHLDMTLHHAINDGLMTLFFFVVGLEIKREVRTGELRQPRAAALPVAAALGGMIVPALIFLAFQAGTPAARGWGIPMATDIAFAIGILSLLGNRVPRGLRVFLLALAIVDDLGAILVIALFYTEQLNLVPLAWAALGLGAVVLLQRLGVWPVPVYAVLGATIWYGFLQSGVHPTIAGVLLGLLTPMRPKLAPGLIQERAEAWAERVHAVSKGTPGHDWDDIAHGLDALERDALSPLSRLEDRLHLSVAYVIMPVFALANAGLVLSAGVFEDAATRGLGLAVGLGLVLGKPLGILLLSFLAVTLRLAQLPAGVGWTQIAAAGVLAGIGFTVSLFIASLSFGEGTLVDGAKIGILAGSCTAGLLGLAAVWLATRGGGKETARKA